MTTIDLNCDLGESFGPWEMGNDAAMIELATSVNVACGYHAGDADIMRKTVEMAKARGVSRGRKPSIDAAKIKQMKADGMGPSAIAKALSRRPKQLPEIFSGSAASLTP